MPANLTLFSNTNPLPQELCLDTSFVVEVFFGIDNPMGSMPPKKQASIDYFENRILKETPNRYITNTVHGEMLEHIIGDVVCGCLYGHAKIRHGARSVRKEYYKAQKDEREFNIKFNPRLSGAIDKFHQWQGDHGVLTLPYNYDQNKSLLGGTPETRNFYMEVVEYCKRYKILPYDERIMNEARNSGVENYVSLDGDFKNVYGIKVFAYY